MRHLIFAPAAILLASTLSSAQVLPEPPGGVPRLTVIQGRVVAQDDAAFPMRGARVELVGGSARADPVFTDADGRFSLGAPVPFTLRVTKAGYAEAIVTGRQGAGNVDVRLTRGAAVTGRVADEFGFPVVNALVRARWVNPPAGVRGLASDATAETDDNGEFRIGSLAAGRYMLNTERRSPGLDSMSGMIVLPSDVALARDRALRAAAGSKPLSDPVTVDVSAGEHAYVAVVHHERAVTPPDAPIGGAVSGTVVDEFGQALQNVVVRLWRLRYADGRQVAEPASLARRTNDLGQFRLFHVPPARYLVVATSDETQHTPVYYPGTTAIGSASPVVIARRQEHPGAHIVFTRRRHARLSGVLQGASGEPLDGNVSLIATGAVTHPPLRVNASATGAFEFPNVVPGEYALQGYRGRSEEFGIRRVVVHDGDNAPVTIVLTPAARITGRVVTDDGRAVPSGLRLTGVLPPEYTTPFAPAGSGNIVADGRFEMRGLMGPVLFVLTPGMRGYRLKSVEVGAVNAAEERAVFESVRDSRDDVTVILSSDVATVSGTVTDSDGRELDDYRVIVFPVDRTKWFTGSPYVQLAAGPNPDGRYVMLDVPPGDYWVAAVNLVEGDAVSGEWQNPDFLGRLALQARRVSAGERQQVTADLSLIRR